MVDVVTAAVRSRMMAGIRGKNTGPERYVRTLLHNAGYRFRIHPAGMPGRPDLVLPKHRIAIFVHGCFWHQHPGCWYARLPASNRAFWRKKLGANRQRDERMSKQLLDEGWRVLVIWECITREERATTELLSQISGWIAAKRRRGELRGHRR